jgi:hypothetical protein
MAATERIAEKKSFMQPSLNTFPVDGSPGFESVDNVNYKFLD